MKNILVLGTGLVSRPGISYLLKEEDLFVTVASNELEKAESFVKGHKNGRAVYVKVEDNLLLADLIKKNDIVVSLLPWIYHPKVAKLCLEFNKNMVTTSYVNPLVREMEAEVKSKGLIFLNEIGLDPGIDHISAMKIINEAKENGEKVIDFYSYCGGLPAPNCNNNPFGYKFSWSPKGVILAARNSARFLENGNVIEIDGKDLFKNYLVEEVEGLGKFEVYPNRDSIPYRKTYGIEGALTVKRGTYRNLGWCETLDGIVKLGLIDETVNPEIKGRSYFDVVAKFFGVSSKENLISEISKRIGTEKRDKIIEKLIWLGLFSDEIIPKANNLLDMLCDRMQEKLSFKNGETDMILMRHKFTIEQPNGKRKQIYSTLIDYGTPYGDTSMSRTVSLPMAIGVKLIAKNQIDMKGVLIPVHKEIYQPVLDELETLGIKMKEEIIN